MFIFEVVFLLLCFVNIGLLLSSAFKNTFLLYTAAFIISGYIIVIPFVAPEYEVSIIFKISMFLLVIPLIYVLVVREKVSRTEDRYFDWFTFWPAIFICVLMVSWLAKRNFADLLWGALIFLLVYFTALCKKVSYEKHKRLFRVLGTVAWMLWILGIPLHPIIAGVGLSWATIAMSLNSNLGWFIFLALFFLGNYAKMGLLDNQAVHKKVFLFFVSLWSISILSRSPELVPFLEQMPFLGKRLSELTAGFTLISVPLVGFMIRKQH